MDFLPLYPNVEDYWALTGLSPAASYPYKPWEESHSNIVINPNTTSALTKTTLALRKDIHVYPES